jgi:hypothetical protein
VCRDGGLSGETVTALHLRPKRRAIVVGHFDGTSFLAGEVATSTGMGSAFVMNVPLPADRSRGDD